MSKMKILHIPNYYYPHIGGIEQTARDCVNALKDEYEQKVICFNSDKKTVKDQVDGIDIVRAGTFIKVSSQAISFSFKKELKKIMKSFQPDIVVFHYPNPFIAHYLCKYLKKKAFKFILWWHLDITKQKLLGKFFEGQNQKLLRYADRIIATSPNYVAGSKYLSSHKDKCIVIPSCINENRLAYDDAIKQKALEIKNQFSNQKLCFAFGRHVEYKGLTYLIASSKLLDDTYAVLIGGQGPLTEQMKKEASGDSKIHFLGRLSDEDLKAYLLACDIFCFSSITKNEAFGLGLAEAMYYEKPAVTFHIPGSGVNYVSLNGVTGIEVENRNIEKYAEAIQSLSDCKIAQEYGLKAKERVLKLFTYEVFSDSIKKFFLDISGKRENV